jgi:hypothetical protein
MAIRDQVVFVAPALQVYQAVLFLVQLLELHPLQVAVEVVDRLKAALLLHLVVVAVVEVVVMAVLVVLVVVVALVAVALLVVVQVNFHPHLRHLLHLLHHHHHHRQGEIHNFRHQP